MTKYTTLKTEHEILHSFVKETMPGVHFETHSKYNYCTILDPDTGVRCTIHNHYDADSGIRLIYTSCGTNFIRDDNRLSDEEYQAHLSRKVGKPFPHYLSYINWHITDRESALEVADALDTFFSEDSDLQWFAKWLRFTAKYCDKYELSR